MSTVFGSVGIYIMYSSWLQYVCIKCTSIALACIFIHSFIHSFINLFVHSFIHLFNHCSIIYSSIHPSIQSIVRRSNPSQLVGSLQVVCLSSVCLSCMPFDITITWLYVCLYVSL